MLLNFNCHTGHTHEEILYSLTVFQKVLQRPLFLQAVFTKMFFISICLDFKMSELSILCVILGILSENHSLSGACRLLS